MNTRDYEVFFFVQSLVNFAHKENLMLIEAGMINQGNKEIVLTILARLHKIAII